MFNPDSYLSLDRLTGNDFVAWTGDLMQICPFKKDGRIIDVGCGPGNLTSRIPDILSCAGASIVGVDISKNMIDYATRNYANNKVSFAQMDISDENLLKKWGKESFDLLISHYTFHWIKDKEKAFQNINSLLKVGGCGFLSTFPYHPFIPYHEKMKMSHKWNDALEDQMALFLYNSIDEEGDLRRLFETANLEIMAFRKYSFHPTFPDMEHFKEYLIAVDPYIHRIEDNKKDEYLQDLANLCLRGNFAKTNLHGIVLNDHLFVVIFKKS